MRTLIVNPCFLLLVAALCSGGPVRAAVIYVDGDAAGAGDGTSWLDAFVHLQDALTNASPGTEIWVADGTYEPDRGADQTPGARTATFMLRSGVMVYGGFEGTEISREERDPAVHVTVLSGDLARNDLPNWGNHGENAHHVVSGVAVDSTAVLDGFTIRGGHAEVASGTNAAAGGILLQDASPTIANSIVKENLAHFGAALGLLPGSPRVRGCRFEGNLAWTGRGGAVYAETGSQPVFTACRFERNSASGASGVGDGGAMFHADGTAVRLVGCVFVGNSSTANQPAYSNGGAICNLGDGMRVESCAFYGNEALQAGAVWTARNVTFVNSIFSGNSSLFGGGLVLFAGNADLVNCDFSRNEADDGGGIAVGWQSLATIRNSILWGNVATNAPSEFKAQVHKSDPSAAAEFRFSAVQGVFTPEPGEDPPDPADFPGCTESDPRFEDPDGPDNWPGTEDDDLSLQPGSPVVDAAENAAVPPGTTLDFAAAPRFFDDPCVEDTGSGTPPIVDMGALEFPMSSCPGAVGWEGAEAEPLAMVSVPNPLRDSCRITFRLEVAGDVILEILDATGRVRRRIPGLGFGPGRHEIAWDGRDQHSRPLPAGVYFVRAEFGDRVAVRKVVLHP